ncbi:MAG: ABC transporter [Novosphingobium sp.]
MLAVACAPARQASGVGLFTSLPIFWREADDIRTLLNSSGPPHWALEVLWAHGEVKPIDSFLPGGEQSPFGEVALLVMAQPRPLAPQENVALDAWVRGGGKVLLFVDPMLTAGSRFALGDRRRPEDIVMLSPILERWGVRLEFDEEQEGGEIPLSIYGANVPVNLPGRLTQVGAGSQCAIATGGHAAKCRVGRGKVLIVADAALFEPVPARADSAERAKALEQLLTELAD